MPIVISIPLKPNQWAEARLKSRFNVAHHFYNAVLGEGLRRQRKFMSHPAYKQAILLTKEYHQAVRDKLDKDAINDIKERSKKLYKEAEENSGFYLRKSEKNGRTNSLEQWYAKVRNGSWIEDHLDSISCQTLTKRAWMAIDRARKSPKKKNLKTGKFEKPKARFKKFGVDHIYSIDAKNPANTLRWIPELKIVQWSAGKTDKHPINIPSIINLEDPYTKFVLDHPESILYTRLKRSQVKGEWRYYAQICCDINPNEIGKERLKGTGSIGLDIGPSEFAFVAEQFAKKSTFCKELLLIEKQVAKLQKIISRKQRENNPQNFEPDRIVTNSNGKEILKLGKTKTGRLKWVVSTREKRLRVKRAELYRKAQECRKCLHGELCNLLRSYGDSVVVEDLNLVSWQKNFGKSVGRRAPGMFIQLLTQKFESSGGEVRKINAYKACLSQICPNCGTKKRKGDEKIHNLSIRVHKCEICGYTMDRDLTSALLALCVDDEDIVQVEKSKKISHERGLLMQEAWDQYKERDN